MKNFTPIYGETSNRIPYAKFGVGKKVILLWFGGPGNLLPKGITFKSQAKDFFPLCEDYTAYIMMRKIGLAPEATTESMAADYAEMIKRDFQGQVDAIVGYSYGGLIAQHFAADFPDLCSKVVIAASTNENKPQGIEIDAQFTDYLSKGQKGKAFSLMMEVIMKPGFVRKCAKVFMRLIGAFLPLPTYPEFNQDLKIEMNAEMTHDAKMKFPNISFPILIFLGEDDYYFSMESAQEMADLIPNSTLIELHDSNHNVTKHPHFLPKLRKYLDS